MCRSAKRICNRVEAEANRLNADQMAEGCDRPCCGRENFLKKANKADLSRPFFSTTGNDTPPGRLA